MIHMVDIVPDYIVHFQRAKVMARATRRNET
jgi:hypothetical protein